MPLRTYLMVLIGLMVTGCGGESVLDADGDGYIDEDDCDDSDATINPGVAEQCDEIDNNCDGLVDVNAVDAVESYQDSDGDGFGLSTVMEPVCEGVPGWVSDSTDCDDLSSTVYPGASEVCDDGVVNDCDLKFCEEGDATEGCTIPEVYCGDLELDTEGSELIVRWSSDCVLQVTDDIGDGVWGDYYGLVDQDGCVRVIQRDVSAGGFFRLRVP